MKRLFLGLAIVIFSLPLVFPFFRSGYFPTHDGEWAVVRLGAMHRALMARQFPARWAGNLNFGYGYPLFLFTYPLPYYLGEFFYLLGFGLVGTIKLLFVLSVIFSGLTMFFLAKEVFGPRGGLISALFYLYAPYRLVDLYVRGSLGESLAFVLYPLLFLSLIKLNQDSPFWLSLGALFYGALILTHNASALLITPFLFAFAGFLVLKANQKKRWVFGRRFLTVFVLGIGLSFFFLFPALTEKSKIALSQILLADKSKHFVTLRQLIIPRWGYGAPGTKDAFSFQLGWVHWLVLFLVLILEWQERKNKKFLVIGFSLVSLLIIVFLMLPLSFLFWQLPFFKEIDFPWRFLGPASFFLALLSGRLGVKHRHFWLALPLMFLVVLVNLRYARPARLIDYPDDYYLTNEATTTSNDELMPIWVKEKPFKRAEKKVEIITGKGKINNIFLNPQKTSFEIEAESDLEVQVNTIYFPGWKIKADGQPVKINYQNPKGLMRFKLQPGKHWVEVRFGETPLRLTADLVSLFSLVMVIIAIIYLRCKGYYTLEVLDNEI